MPSESDFSSPFRRVLLIESDFSIIRQTTRALAPNSVTSVPTLDQASEILDRYQFDVVVFDPHDLDGGLDFLLELTRELPRVRRVIYSRHALAERGFGLAHATLHKPAHDSELRAAVLSASDSREFRPIKPS